MSGLPAALLGRLRAASLAADGTAAVAAAEPERTVPAALVAELAELVLDLLGDARGPQRSVAGARDVYAALLGAVGGTCRVFPIDGPQGVESVAFAVRCLREQRDSRPTTTTTADDAGAAGRGPEGAQP